MISDDPLWYRDAIIYELHVKAFFDSNDEGIGDFAGLARKLDYLQDLGVTAIWFLPFYPSPLRDDGYDIADYRDVHPAYGTLRDFRRLVREAHRRGLRVVTELVVNHTSDQHPWFQRSRRAKPGSAWRNYYVWSDTDQAYQDTRIIFTDTETSNWAWDPVAQAYYWHRFFSHQPDLNFANPRVLDQVQRAMKFWLDMGVDGMRLDALPYLCEREGTNNENLPETHDVVKRLRGWLDQRYTGRMFLAEANQWPEDVRPYFGDGDECHMAFHFPLMPRIYMAIAQEDRHPITDIMRQTPDIPETCQWAIFLRNHDELTLEMVTDRERDYLWDFYAADRRARINLGIRRRLAPLLENDRRKIELLNSLLMSMPGTPILYYGDEIGMGDNIYLGDRDGVRTPMQWSPDRNAGFSRADPAQLYLPPIMDPVYGYEAVNVEAQSRSSSSLLNWMKRLIEVRKAHAAFGRGTLRFLYPGNRKLLAYLREYAGQTVLCLANLARSAQPVELNLSEFRGRVPVELIGSSPFPPIGELPYFVTLPAYGFYWFLLAEEAEAPSWHEPFVAPLPEFLTLVLPQGWASLVEPAASGQLEAQILPEFLPAQRWFAAKDRPIAGVELVDSARVSDRGLDWLMSLWKVRFSRGKAQVYSMPLSLAWEEKAEEPLATLLHVTLARVRRGARLGVLYDALSDGRFASTVVELMREEREVPTNGGGRIVFWPAAALREAEAAGGLAAERMGREQSNTSVLLGDRMILKAYRRLDKGVHPELEIGRYLTEVAGYANTPAFLGAAELVEADGSRRALAVLQELVPNQGDGWSYTLDYLAKAMEEEALLAPEAFEPAESRHAVYLTLMRTLGARTAELHRAFALDTDDPAFRPVPVTPADLAKWSRQVHRQADRAFRAMKRPRRGLARGVRDQIQALLAQRGKILARIDRLAPSAVDALKTRLHGDFHLGQTLVHQNDFYILDFEGEPARTLAERRAKHCPLRDVAGMLRSIDYAGWTTLFERVHGGAGDTGEVRARIDTWRDLAGTAFLAGYRDAIGDCRSYPADPEQVRRLTELFVLEKALYEVCYEAANRPDWLHIPLAGVLRIMERGA